MNNKFSINIIDDIVILFVNVEIFNLNIFFFAEIIQIIDLHDILYVFNLFVKLFFTTQFTSHDDMIFFDENQCIIHDKKIEIYTINAIQFENVMTINDNVINL